MELAAILIFDADCEIDFTREVFVNPEARHDLVSALP